jgi:hypothetical protein
MVCLYLREWLPTGTRSPDPATQQCAKHRAWVIVIALFGRMIWILLGTKLIVVLPKLRPQLIILPSL